MTHLINWFEIPVTDMDRAAAFYSTVLGMPVTQMPMGDILMGFIGQGGENIVSGALCKGEWYTPSGTGTLVYLNGGDDLATPLSRVEGAGGSVIVPKTQISPEHGYFAVFADTEGNHIGLHSIG